MMPWGVCPQRLDESDTTPDPDAGRWAPQDPGHMARAAPSAEVSPWSCPKGSSQSVHPLNPGTDGDVLLSRGTCTTERYLKGHPSTHSVCTHT